MKKYKITREELYKKNYISLNLSDNKKRYINPPTINALSQIIQLMIEEAQ